MVCLVIPSYVFGIAEDECDRVVDLLLLPHDISVDLIDEIAPTLWISLIDSVNILRRHTVKKIKIIIVVTTTTTPQCIVVVIVINIVINIYIVINSYIRGFFGVS